MGVVRTVIPGVLILALASGIGLLAHAPRAAEPVAAHQLQQPPATGAPAPGSGEAASSSLSMDQAVKMAEQRFKARVVRAETSQDGARVIYVLKLLDEAGHVWTVRVDATNGAIL